MSRTNNSIRNMIFSLVGQLTKILIAFATRSVFIFFLSEEYLGISGLFTSIISMLSLAELGVGTAITYSLYKPLAEKDTETIKALMDLFRRAYLMIGCIVLFLGGALTPFLGFFIKDIPDISDLELIYLLYVLQSGTTYFFSYRRTLLIADQKQYISTLYHDTAYIVFNILQIIVLAITSNFVLYLSVQICINLAENFLISKKATKLYPFLKEKNKPKLSSEMGVTIRKNIVAMMGNKIGGVVVLGTDNLLISKFVGIVVVGLYSNYLLITTAVSTVSALVISALTASIGNLVAKESDEKIIQVFQVLNFSNFWIHGFAAICLYQLLNPFITIWIGAQFLFEQQMVFLIVMNFYLTGMRQGVLGCKGAYGLYWEDRYKPIAEAAINLLFSIVLALRYGIVGVFLGTTISTMLTCFWVEPYILYKYGFKQPVFPYFASYIKYTCCVLVNGLVTVTLCNSITISGILGFAFQVIVCLLVPNILVLVEFRSTEELAYLKNVLLRLLKKVKTL